MTLLVNHEFLTARGYCYIHRLMTLFDLWKMPSSSMYTKTLLMVLVWGTSICSAQEPSLCDELQPIGWMVGHWKQLHTVYSGANLFTIRRLLVQASDDGGRLQMHYIVYYPLGEKCYCRDTIEPGDGGGLVVTVQRIRSFRELPIVCPLFEPSSDGKKIHKMSSAKIHITKSQIRRWAISMQLESVVNVRLTDVNTKGMPANASVFEDRWFSEFLGERVTEQEAIAHAKKQLGTAP